MDNEMNMVNLGWMNGWDYQHEETKQKREEILRRCRNLGHRVKESSGFGRCVSKCECAECGYYYQVDSSD